MKQLSQRRVLIVEDSDEDFDTVEEAARKMQLPDELVRASTIETALETLDSAHAAGSGFCLVLLDQSMPGGDGDELLSQLRASVAHRNLPVVMLTGGTRVAECLECYLAGANAYHHKPSNFHEHLQTVQGIFRYWMQSVRLPGRRDVEPPK